MESFCLLTLSNGSYFANILQKYTYCIYCTLKVTSAVWKKDICGGLYICGDEKEMKMCKLGFHHRYD